jgi:hypothetical protein
VWKRKSVSERELQYVGKSKRVCVWGKIDSVCERESVCVCVCVCVRPTKCEWVKEREREGEIGNICFASFECK